jgi:hypothetical protein
MKESDPKDSQINFNGHSFVYDYTTKLGNTRYSCNTVDTTTCTAFVVLEPNNLKNEYITHMLQRNH